MIRKRSKLTNSDIGLRNWGKLDFLKNTEKMMNGIKEDVNKKDRLSKSTCLVCYYDRRGIMVTNASVTTNCRSCNKKITFGNSNTDEVCLECAKEHKLCVHCGSDIEYKQRKKYRAFNFDEELNNDK